MRVKNLMIKNVKYINQNKTIKEAASIMIKNSIGSVIVEDDDGEMAGILTERDVLRTVAKGCDCNELVKNQMTKNVIKIDKNVEIADAIDLMVKKNIKKLVVMNEDNVCGIITASDILKSGDKLEEEVLLKLAKYFPVKQREGYAG